MTRATARAAAEPATSYAGLLVEAAADPAPIIRIVARDVASPGEAIDEVEREVRPAVQRLLAALAEGPAPGAATIAALRAEGAEAARLGLTVERVIDRYLSAGWAVWSVVSERLATAGRRVDPRALSDLGAALLRTGDVAAAAIADGHGATVRQVAGRAATARAELLEELLEGPSSPDALARVARHAAALGLDPAGDHEVLLATAGPDGREPDVQAAAAVLERRSGGPARGWRPGTFLAGARGERLVVVLPAAVPGRVATEAVTAALGTGWVATRSAPVSGLAAVRAGYLEASAAVVALHRADVRERVVPAAEVLVERTLLADEAVLRAMVEHVLGPIERAPRGGSELVATLETWIESGLNGQATARRLGLAPRTVAYRLGRVERLTGRRLDGVEVARLSVALLGRRLIAR